MRLVLVLDLARSAPQIQHARNAKERATTFAPYALEMVFADHVMEINIFNAINVVAQAWDYNSPIIQPVRDVMDRGSMH